MVTTITSSIRASARTAEYNVYRRAQSVRPACTVLNTHTGNGIRTQRPAWSSALSGPISGQCVGGIHNTLSRAGPPREDKEDPISRICYDDHHQPSTFDSQLTSRQQIKYPLKGSVIHVSCAWTGRRRSSWKRGKRYALPC